jgi:hypothetical protein
MMPRGVPIAQIESNTEADPKLQRLSRRLDSTAYGAAFGAYMSIVLRSWATGARDADADHLELLAPGAVEALKSVGLLDETSAIPEAVFARWIGSVLDATVARREQLAAIASQGGKARAAAGSRDDHGRLQPEPAVTQPEPAVTAGGDQPKPAVPAGFDQPSTSRHQPSLQPYQPRGDIEERVTSSPSSAEEEEDAQVSPILQAPRSEADWLAFIVEKDPAPRPGKTGKLLSTHAERIARLADYFQERFGRAFDPKDGGRLAALVKGDEGGYTAVMGAIAEAAARDPKGDPIDYITTILKRRASRGESARVNGSRFAPNLNDYDAIAAERLAAGV